SFPDNGWRLCRVSGLKTRQWEDGDFSKDTKARYWRPFLAPREASRRTADWLAGDAVLIAPVSKANSLVSGNFTGNFAILGLLGRTPLQRNRCPAATSRAIPYADYQGK